MSDLQGVLDELGARKREERTKATEARKAGQGIHITADKLKARKETKAGDLIAKLSERKATERQQAQAAQRAEDIRKEDERKAREDEAEQRAKASSHVSRIVYDTGFYKIKQ